MVDVDGIAAQAAEWVFESPFTTGKHTAQLLHCITDGSVTAHFKEGDKTRAFSAGDDITLDNVEVTITSGSFDIN